MALRSARDPYGELADTERGVKTPPKRFSRRLFGGVLVAGGIAATSPAVEAWAATAPPAGAGAYGSGTLGNWTAMSQSVSTPASISLAVARDGVLAFGDSIGVSTFRDLATRLRTYGTLLAVNAKGGRPTAPTVDILKEWSTTYHLPRRILMATGSNDIFNPSGFSTQISRVMTIAGPGVTVYWSEIHVSRWSKPVGVQVADQRNSDWLNVQLHAATAKHQNLKIISWALFLAQQPAYRIRAYLADGVHTTTAGTAVRNAAITSRIQAVSR